MLTTTLVLLSEQDTKQFAVGLADCLTPSLVLTFTGEIGAGKTTLIRALLQTLGVKSSIKSPTFSLVEHYQLAKWTIYHFDLYRITQPEELEYIGFRDYFNDKSLICIEWPERASDSLDRVDINFALALYESGRVLAIQALSVQGEKVLSCLKGKQ